MGFLNLLYVASIPVLKVLLITGLGSVLALDSINLLGESARKQVNNIVFYVLNPSLVGSNLAQTITLDNVVSLWFMPVNILITFMVGSLLGWLLIKITRPSKQLEGLVLGSCAAGNLGNLPIIIVPAMCKEKGSPFGDPNVCHKYAMSYASLSMAVGSVFIWTYVFNMMRICSNEAHKEVYTSQISIHGNSAQGTLPLLSSEALFTEKDSKDDAYTQVPCAEQDDKVKLFITEKIKRWLRDVSRKINLKAVVTPSTIAVSIGFVIGVAPPIRSFVIGSDAPLRVVQDSASMLGEAAIPIITLILGANLVRGLRGARSILSVAIGIVGVRYILLPLCGILIVKGASRIGLLQSDPLYLFVLLIQYALPPAMNIGTMAQLFGAGESECSVIMLWTYALASVAVTLWSTFFLWMVSQ